MVELLAPAGDLTSLKAALNNNCNSVYIGLNNYNMRKNTTNFSIENIQKITKIVHENNSKIYICINTSLNDESIYTIEKQLPLLKKYNVDAVIIADLGLIELATENNLDVHMSVQANISNIKSLSTLKKLGVKRSLLSRELNLKQITEIAKNSPIETEIFIHGALCMAVSGRCFLSSYFYNKSANRGECLQPCRKKWKLSSTDNEEIIMYNNKKYTHFLSPRDLCMIQHIPELMNSHVNCFKIEGRARSAEYVATTTRVYNEAIQSFQNNNYQFQKQWLIDLKKVFNRGFDQGLYFNNYNQNSPHNQSTHQKKDIGKVINYYNKNKAAEIKIWHNLKIGDEIIIQGPTTGSINHIIDSIQINNKNYDQVEKNKNIAIKLPLKVRKNDLVYLLIKKTKHL